MTQTNRRTKLRQLLLRVERYFLYHLIRLFRIRDASERIARGFSLGMVVNFFPTFGFGVLVSGFFARLLGGNALAGFVGGATLTFFWPFLFYLNMLAGGWFHGRREVSDPALVTEEQMRTQALSVIFMTGAIINTLVVGAVVYGLWLWIFRYYRAHGLAFLRKLMKHHQRKALSLRRLSRSPDTVQAS